AVSSSELDSTRCSPSRMSVELGQALRIMQAAYAGRLSYPFR
ncbi:MAG: hypothetical protein QOD05_116, partial [Microbacteriaceae bacterium]|nr:hypothetical protein [Microbacteriaceae bacterium]